MNLRFQENCENVSWEYVQELLRKVEMAATEPSIHRLSFEKSTEVLFVFDEEKLIGMGRAISDGVRQAALYDVAVDPSYQGLGVGKRIVQHLMQKLHTCNFMLYASPGKEDFYRKLNFKKMKTGMILFSNPERMNNSDFVE